MRLGNRILIDNFLFSNFLKFLLSLYLQRKILVIECNYKQKERTVRTASVKNMTDLEIMMMDRCTKSEAEKHLRNGSVVFEREDFEKNFDSYMDEWDIDDEDRAEYKSMIDEKKPVTDWGIVEYGDKTWYIMYVL